MVLKVFRLLNKIKGKTILKLISFVIFVPEVNNENPITSLLLQA